VRPHHACRCTYPKAQHTFGDTNLYFRKLAHDGTVELRIEHRATACPEPIQLRLVVDDEPVSSARFVALGNDRSFADPLAARVFAALVKAQSPMSARALRAALGVRNQLVGDALRTLHDQGRIRRDGRDGWSVARNDSGSQPL
jgi:hypothetical protein